MAVVKRSDMDAVQRMVNDVDVCVGICWLAFTSFERR